MSQPSSLPSLPPEHPMASRQTLQSLQNEEGVIIKTDAENYLIQMPAPGLSLFPLNLPAAFQQQGLPVVFSGAVKETGLNEFFAGQPLVLTFIEAK